MGTPAGSYIEFVTDRDHFQKSRVLPGAVSVSFVSSTTATVETRKSSAYAGVRLLLFGHAISRMMFYFVRKFDSLTQIATYVPIFDTIEAPENDTDGTAGIRIPVRLAARLAHAHVAPYGVGNGVRVSVQGLLQQ